MVDGYEDGLLAVEVAVDGAGGDACLGGDVLHRRAVVAISREAGPGGVEDLALAGFDVLIGYTCHVVAPVNE